MLMPDICTCGAVLVPDARFCHKCGRPLRDDAPVEVTPVVERFPVNFTPPPQLATLGFQNPVALRAALAAAWTAALPS